MKNAIEAIERSISNNEVVRVDASLQQVVDAARALGYNYGVQFLYDYVEAEDYMDVWGWYNDTPIEELEWRLRVRSI